MKKLKRISLLVVALSIFSYSLFAYYDGPKRTFSYKDVLIINEHLEGENSGALLLRAYKAIGTPRFTLKDIPNQWSCSDAMLYYNADAAHYNFDTRDCVLY